MGLYGIAKGVGKVITGIAEGDARKVAKGIGSIGLGIFTGSNEDSNDDIE